MIMTSERSGPVGFSGFDFESLVADRGGAPVGRGESYADAQLRTLVGPLARELRADAVLVGDVAGQSLQLRTSAVVREGHACPSFRCLLVHTPYAHLWDDPA